MPSPQFPPPFESVPVSDYPHYDDKKGTSTRFLLLKVNNYIRLLTYSLWEEDDSSLLSPWRPFSSLSLSSSFRFIHVLIKLGSDGVMSHPKESCVDEVQPLRSATSSTVTPSLKKEHHPLCGSPGMSLSCFTPTREILARPLSCLSFPIQTPSSGREASSPVSVSSVS